MSSWAGLGTLGNLGPGSIVAGKYRLEHPLAAGGMGVVLAATHEQLQLRVAIKFLLEANARSPAARTRFVREARAAAMIQSEHVVRVTDVGELEPGIPYLVMEYLEGQDLAALSQERGPLPVTEALGYLLQAAEGLAAAHVLGIVHRDVKPSNLFVAQRANRRDVVKVLDFGISKLVENPQGNEIHLTTTRGLMGSPSYMAPEQIRSARDVDARADIWALGLVLYELLTAQAAFEAESAPALFAKIVTEPPRPLEPELRVPPALERVLLRCLEKDRDRRFASMAELAQSLEPFADAEGKRSVVQILAAGQVNQRGESGRNEATLTTNQPRLERGSLDSPHPSVAAWGRTSARAGRVRVPLLVVASALIALIALLLLRALSRDLPVTAHATSGSAPRASAPLPSTPPLPIAPVAQGPAPRISPDGAQPARVTEPSVPPTKPQSSAGASGAKTKRPPVSREEVVFDGTQ